MSRISRFNDGNYATLSLIMVDKLEAKSVSIPPSNVLASATTRVMTIFFVQYTISPMPNGHCILCIHLLRLLSQYVVTVKSSTSLG